MEKTTNPDQPLSFSSLPDEIAENCLASISKWNYTSLSLVSKRFLSILSSPKLYTTRSRIGTTEPCFYFCLKLPKYPSPKWFTLLMKPPDDEDDDDIQDEYSLVPIPSYSSSNHSHVHVPYSSSTVAVGSEIYLIGGPNDNSPPSTSVRILDCQSHTWRDGPSMIVERAGAFAVYLDEKIYVMGGCESWMEVFDVKTQTWMILASHEAASEELQRERWFKINVINGKIYVIADKKDYAYDPEEGTWEVVETNSNSGGSLDAWCVIENVMYCYTNSGYCKWYDSKSREWREVKGSDFDVLREDVICSLVWPYRLEIHNYGGKLLVFWVPSFEEDNAKRKRRIWCAKIALERSYDGGEIWGKMDWTNTVLTVPKSFKFLSCAVVSI